MSEEQATKKLDPTEQLRGMRDTYMDVWAKAMGELVNTDAYAQQSGAALDAYLAASQPFRASLEKAMVSALQQLSMPTRPDFISLAERLTNLEMRLDDMDNKLDEIGRAIVKIASAPVRSAEPPATPKPTAAPQELAKPAASAEHSVGHHAPAELVSSPAHTEAPKAIHPSKKFKKKGVR